MKKETFEDKLIKSKELLEKLMDPDITLEDSVKAYDEGLKNIKSAFISFFKNFISVNRNN